MLICFLKNVPLNIFISLLILLLNDVFKESFLKVLHKNSNNVSQFKTALNVQQLHDNVVVYVRPWGRYFRKTLDFM